MTEAYEDPTEMRAELHVAPPCLAPNPSHQPDGAMGKSTRTDFNTDGHNTRTWYRRGACCQSSFPIIRFNQFHLPSCSTASVGLMCCTYSGFLTKLEGQRICGLHQRNSSSAVRQNAQQRRKEACHLFSSNDAPIVLICVRLTPNGSAQP